MFLFLRPSSFRRSCCAAILLTGLTAFTGNAQQAQPGSEQQAHIRINVIVESLATQLIAAHKKKLVVFDLVLPETKPSPLGDWLADQISETLEQTHPELEIIPRSKWKSALTSMKPPKNRSEEIARKNHIAKSLGAKLVVQGIFAGVAEGIGITISANESLSGGQAFFEARGEIPLTPELQAKLPNPLPGIPIVNGSYTAGVGGIGTPTCVECPMPDYSGALRLKGIQGVVSLDVQVTSEGKTSKIGVLKSPDDELTNLAVNAVSRWLFKPALNSNGVPVSATVPIEVSFQLR
jgi:TonB family protein